MKWLRGTAEIFHLSGWPISARTDRDEMKTFIPGSRVGLGRVPGFHFNDRRGVPKRQGSHIRCFRCRRECRVVREGRVESYFVTACISLNAGKAGPTTNVTIRSDASSNDPQVWLTRGEPPTPSRGIDSDRVACRC